MKKIWKVKRLNKSFTDEELIEHIKSGYIKGDDMVISNVLENYICIKDSIYQFYLKESNNETL